MFFNHNNDIDEKENKSIKLPIIIIIGVILFILIILLIARSFNKKNVAYEDKLYYITLAGDNSITVYLDEEYNEPGYTGKDDRGKDLTNEVVTVGNVDSHTEGTYKISYTLGNVTKERIVNVVKKPVGATYIYLYGDLNVYLYVGETYVEKGYTVIDSVDGDKLKENVTIKSTVDTSKEGIYKIVYSVVNSGGVTTSTERTVIVTNHDFSLIPNPTNSTNDNVVIGIYVKDELFDYLVLSDGKKINTRVGAYEVSRNGTYKFVMYNTKGELTEKTITITNIDKEAPSGSCSGYYQNGASNISVNAKDNNKISRYVIEGVSYTTSSIKVNSELPSVDITVYDEAGNSAVVSCSLTNKNTGSTTTTKTPTSSNGTTTTKTTTTAKTTTTTSPSLNVSSSFNDYNSAGYSLYIPENATVGMPLFVMVSPSATGHTDIKRVFTNNWPLEKIPAFIMIAHNMTNYSQIRKNVDNIVSKYSIDTSRISAYGFSSSGTYVYYLLAKNKDLFSALVVVSSGMTCDYDVIKNNKDYFKSLPTIGFGETGGQYDANGRKCSGYTNWSPSGHMKPLFSCLGMSDKFTDLGKICHSQVTRTVFTMDKNNDNKSDVIEWSISQTKK